MLVKKPKSVAERAKSKIRKKTAGKKPTASAVKSMQLKWDHLYDEMGIFGPFTLL